MLAPLLCLTVLVLWAKEAERGGEEGARGRKWHSHRPVSLPASPTRRLWPRVGDQRQRMGSDAATFAREARVPGPRASTSRDRGHACSGKPFGPCPPVASSAAGMNAVGLGPHP